jgi:hypothetical protein
MFVVFSGCSPCVFERPWCVGVAKSIPETKKSEDVEKKNETFSI